MILTIEGASDLAEFVRRYPTLTGTELVKVMIRKVGADHFEVTFTKRTGLKVEADFIQDWYIGSHWDAYQTELKNPRSQRHCGHFFVDYIGFREKYRYCKYCDKKEE